MAIPAALLFSSRALAVEELYVYHILVRSRAEADKALDEIVNAPGGATRENFVKAARRYSMDHPTKGSGGDLGWNSRRKFVKEFADEAFDTAPGEVSQPVRTQYGWHLIYIKDRRDLQAEAQSDPEKAKSAPAAPAAAPGHEGHDHAGHDHADHDHAGHDHAKPAPANPAAAASSTAAASAVAPPPASTPAVVNPIHPPLLDRQLKLTLELQSRVVTATLPLVISITLENLGAETLKVFSPELLPLGLSIRTDSAPAEPPGTWGAVPEPASYVVDLSSRSISGRTYVVNDYFKDLPASSRLWISWDPAKFSANFEQRFPGKAAQIDNFALATRSFDATKVREFIRDVRGLPEHRKRVFSPKQELPATIFDPIRSSEKYYARLKVANQPGEIWFELFASQQLPAVEHFASLVNQGFYDGLRFYEIKAGEYLQGGCPRDDGTGVPDRVMPLSNVAKIKHEKGILSMATRPKPRAAAREAGSIFFIARKDLGDFDATHVPIGRMVLGEETLAAVEKRPTATIETISIVPAARAPQNVAGAAGTQPAVAGASTAPKSGDGPDTINYPELPRVLIQTSKGDLTVELYQEDARNTVASFLDLVEKGFYNPNAAAQKSPLQFFDKQAPYYVRTGSPDNSETGNPGYTIASETASNTRMHEKGTLSMCLDINAKNGQPIPNSGGSQFFICLQDVPYWNGLYTPFGKVVGGIEVVDRLDQGDAILGVKVLQKRAGVLTPSVNRKTGR
jgi:cyclophilin family peptidyl-prolyl cis-trans isomerase